MPRERAVKTQDVSSEPTVTELANGGRIVRGPGGRFLPGTRSPAPITAENSHELARLRKEKTREAIRDAIAASTDGVPTDLPADLRAPAAIGAAAGMIWRDVVMADAAVLQRLGLPMVYARDRIEAWDRIGKRADLLSDDKQAPTAAAGDALLGLLELAAPLIAARVQAQRDSVVDAVVSDAEADDR